MLPITVEEIGTHHEVERHHFYENACLPVITDSRLEVSRWMRGNGMDQGADGGANYSWRKGHVERTILSCPLVDGGWVTDGGDYMGRIKLSRLCHRRR